MWIQGFQIYQRKKPALQAYLFDPENQEKTARDFSDNFLYYENVMLGNNKIRHLTLGNGF